MHGIGRTVFNGNKVEEFQVEILGVLENIGPKESLILGRLSGGPLEHTGVMQGMSGSPVYIDGKLVGAVAMAFPFAKDPIAGIRPIEAMVRASNSDAAPASPPPPALGQLAAVALGEKDLTRRIPRPEPAMSGDARMIDIATPMSFGGFSRATLDTFAPQLRALGLEPRQGVTSGAKIEPVMGNPADLKPGSMISVQLMSGDLSVGADGTVTHIDGNRIYAFGHRFLDVGATALPFARAEVLTLLANTNTSFKISSAKEWMGTINQDRNTAVSGELGKRAAMVPVTISLSRSGKPIDSYQMQMVNDTLLSPLLLQMAVFSAIDATERTSGASSIRVTGDIEFENAPSLLRINNMYSADNGSAMQASLSAAVSVAYVMQGGFERLKLKHVALRLEAFDQKKQLAIDSITPSRHDVRAGEKLQLNIAFTGENGAETHPESRIRSSHRHGAGHALLHRGRCQHRQHRRFPPGAHFHPPQPRTARFHGEQSPPQHQAYVRVWRADPAYQLEGSDLPDPPASIALILGGSQSSTNGITQTRNSKIGEMEVDTGDMVVTGTKTVQVEVKE